MVNDKNQTLFEHYRSMITALLTLWLDVPRKHLAFGMGVNEGALTYEQKVQLVRRCLLVEGARLTNGNDDLAIQVAQERFPLFVTPVVEKKVVEQHVIELNDLEFKLSECYTHHSHPVLSATRACDVGAVLWVRRRSTAGEWHRFGEGSFYFMVDAERLDVFDRLLAKPTVEKVETTQVKRAIVASDKEFRHTTL